MLASIAPIADEPSALPAEYLSDFAVLALAGHIRRRNSEPQYSPVGGHRRSARLQPSAGESRPPKSASRNPLHHPAAGPYAPLRTHRSDAETGLLSGVVPDH